MVNLSEFFPSMNAEEVLTSVKESREQKESKAIDLGGQKWAISIDPTNLHKAAQHIRSILPQLPNLFVKFGRLHKIVKIPNVGIQNKYEAIELDDALLLEVLQEYIKFTKSKGNGEESGFIPPVELIRMVRKGELNNLAPLTKILNTPIIHTDGSIHNKGYDKTTGKFVYLDVKLDLPDIADQAEAKKAVSKLYELIDQMPLVTARDRAVWLANILTPLAMDAYRGHAPLFYYRSSSAGSGKTQLTQAAAQIAQGKPMKEIHFTRNNDVEIEKLFASLLLADHTMVVVDNAGNGSTIDSPILDSLVTGSCFTVRRLGGNQIIDFNPRMVLSLTANNADLGGDTARRVLIADLDSALMPDVSKDGYKLKDICEHIENNWAEYLGAAITILLGYLCLPKDERDTFKITPYGSFESWGEVVGGAILWATGEDVSKAVAKRDHRADITAQKESTLLSTVLKYCDNPTEKFFINEITKLVKDNTDGYEELADIITNLTGTLDFRYTGVRLCNVLRTMCGKKIPIIDENGIEKLYSIVLTPHSTNNSRGWRLMVEDIPQKKEE